MNSVEAWTYPWSGWDPVTRVLIPDGGAVLLSGTAAALLSVDGDGPLRAADRGHGAEPWRDRSSLMTDQGMVSLWALPAPARSADLQTKFVAGPSTEPNTPFAVVQDDAVLRPSRDRREVADPHTRERAFDLDMVVSVLVDRFERAVEAARGLPRVLETGRLPGLARPTWASLTTTILEGPDADEPSMALVVRHAELHRRLVADLAERPRRVLRRERRLQPLDRIQEMDAACLTWYTRQPGRTAAQKAGPRQELMGVVRRETVDTLENRVLKDFLVRTVAEADRYTIANRALSTSRRYRSVHRYGAGCRQLLARPELDEVRTLAGVPTPNYVLQRDRRYRALWDAYLELVHRDEVLDEAWTWQRRLWADAVALAVACTIDTAPGVRVLRQGFPYLRVEQDHGRWSQTGVPFRWAVADGAEPTFLELTGGPPNGEGSREPVDGLRADARIRAVGADGRERQVTVVWAIHGTGVGEADAAEALLSAERALDAWSRRNSDRRVRGLIVQPTWSGDGVVTLDGDRTVFAQVPLSTAGLGDLVAHLEQWVIGL